MTRLTQYFDMRPRDALGALILVLLTMGLPLVIANDYHVNVLVLVFLYAGMASAWNILGGMAGQFSLGHTAFFGTGAYTSTLLYNFAGVSPWIGMVAGGLLSMVFAVIIAYPAFRMRGVFFAMATLAFGEAIRILLIYSRKHVDMPYGLSINWEPAFGNMIFEERSSYALLAGVFLLIVTLTAYGLSRSHAGIYLRAIRDSEEAAVAAGIPMRRYKMIALLISAFFTSAGGTLLAQYVLYIEPTTVFSMAYSVDLPLMALLGGIGTVAGPILGAFIALPLRDVLLDLFGSGAAGLHLVVYGVLLMVIVIVLPSGLIGGARSLLSWLTRRTAARKSEDT
ncbi:high-affinity branched-chain amino acid transport system permease protein livh / high-affinity branched-chain amino acid [Pseudooceanicola batsensis HTCC2597]|uniref:High-affinity branched-chain amino acid transport system permease protein livh / high-affinity branched-chain amino acid n=1 Tax=Pseudooceanicola batsensis (strain ATCC BAA-863 / DSM 15984 / KCTC 12145 / HTCC2597) TaxID=252305 RepID=A3U1C4_PSEBH|nr:branched-chain amino acid ABC transporter permease [Pseudooceanicola batsensis]EAQ02107.1 high-affinity branched-chain amino acid transport system permease protein livh / high-affinity branched-chain amino acid [Pseudooceanicola batsensis HTCC2597]